MRSFGGALMAFAMLFTSIAEAYTLHVDTFVCNASVGVAVPVTIDSVADLSFVSVRLVYDPQILTLKAVEAGMLGEVMDDDFTVSTNEVGYVVVGMFGVSNVVEAAGSIAVLKFDVHQNTERLYSDITIVDVQMGEMDGVKDMTVGNPIQIENGMIRIMPDSATVTRLENAQTVMAGTRLASLSLKNGDAISAEDGSDGVMVSGIVAATEISVSPPRQGWKNGEYRLLSTVTSGLSLTLSGLSDEDRYTIHEKFENGSTVYMASVQVAAPPVLTLGEALNENLYWLTDGDVVWQPRAGSEAAHPIYADVCGLGHDGYSRVWTYVYGEGTLTFDWSGNVEDSYDRFEFSVDGVCKGAMTGERDWTTVSVSLGQGKHLLEWLFRKDQADTEQSESFYARLDNVVWSPVDSENAVQTSAAGDVRSVPFLWLKNHRAYLDSAFGDYEVAVRLAGRNGRPLWQSYVAGLDPDDETSDFKTYIEMVDGTPKITWKPDLGDDRTYTIWGKKALIENEWKLATESNMGEFNFFKVQVDLK